MQSHITYTVEELASALTRTFAPRCPRDNRPRVVNDTTDKGVPVMEFILPHPTEPRFSVSLQADERKGAVEVCTLWFGQAEVTGALPAADAEAAIEEIISDRIVAVIRYKNREAYENHRKSREWLFQITDDADSDEAELNRFLARLSSPATFADRLGGTYVGVFEVIRWSGCTVLER